MASTSWWVTLIAALGIGSIISAVVGGVSANAVAISNHRQSWINALRDDLAIFLGGIDVLHYRHAMVSQGNATREDLEKLQDARNSAMLAYRRIHMRLNMTETPCIELSNRLNDLMTRLFCKSSGCFERVNRLKAAWNKGLRGS